MKDYKKVVEIPVEKIKIISKDVRLLDDEMMKNVHNKLKEIGFKYVTLDLNGYQMGSLNN